MEVKEGVCLKINLCYWFQVPELSSAEPHRKVLTLHPHNSVFVQHGGSFRGKLTANKSNANMHYAAVVAVMCDNVVLVPRRWIIDRLSLHMLRLTLNNSKTVLLQLFYVWAKEKLLFVQRPAVSVVWGRCWNQRWTQVWVKHSFNF